MPVIVNFGIITTRTIRNNAGIFSGENVLFDWDSHTKTNQSSGNFSGNFVWNPMLINIINDHDFIDMPVRDVATAVANAPAIVKAF